VSASRYRLIRPLGVGHSTAGVYLAEHLDLGRQVAVKLLEVRHVTHRDELLDEARKMATLERDDNVIQVLDAGDWDARHVYIATEACLDGSLETRSATAVSGVDPASACHLISGACRGLDFMHRNGMLHLDVRPANILLDGTTPKIGDFGLARWTGDATVPQVYAPHAAPEMLRDYDGTEASDQYAMAMTLAHLLTSGAICLLPPDPADLKGWKSYPPLRLLALNIPDGLRRVIAHATSYDPAKRYKDVEAFKRAIDRATPTISFTYIDPSTMQSADKSWWIRCDVGRKGHSVEVRHNGRRDNRYAVTSVDGAAANKHIGILVSQFAYG
jgi:serine/threonine protein kinase